MGIHSYNTFENYKQETMQFINFLKVNNTDIKKLNDIKEEHVKEYLLKGQAEGKSPYTSQKRMACLNKIFNMELTKKEVGLNPISYKNIFKGREEKTEKEKRYNPAPREKLTEREFKEFYKKDAGDVLFNKYTNLINNHAFRREFAQSLYNQLADAKTSLKTDYRGAYDKEILQEVSKALGHSRLDVVVENYLR